jgi:hypothetical protein
LILGRELDLHLLFPADIWGIKGGKSKFCVDGRISGRVGLSALIPFHYKYDTFGDQEDKEDKEDKGDDLYQEFCEMVLNIFN